MSSLAASLLLLFLAGSIVWWQTRFIRQQIPEEEYQGDRGALIGIGGFITIILGFNAVTLIQNLEIDWVMEMSSYDPPGRFALLIRQVGFLCGFYVFAMVFWGVIRRRVFDLQREVWAPRVEYGMGEHTRLVAGSVLALISIPSVLRNAFSPFGSMAGGVILLLMIPAALFAIELVFGVVMTWFLRTTRRMNERQAER